MLRHREAGLWLGIGAIAAFCLCVRINAAEPVLAGQAAGKLPEAKQSPAAEPPIAGIVVDAEGRPIPGAEVYVLQREPKDWPRQVGWRSVAIAGPIVTGSDGRFSFDFAGEIEAALKGHYLHEYAGPIVIAASKKGHAIGWSEHRDSPEYGEIICLRRAESISGMVIDAAGKGVPNAKVEAFGGYQTAPAELQTGMTDANGAFRIDGLEPFSKTGLRIMPEGQRPMMPYSDNEMFRRFKAGQKDAVIIIPEMGTVKGLVQDADTGKSIAGVKLAIWPSESMQGCIKTVSEENGEFEIRNMLPGEYKLQPENIYDATGPYYCRSVKFTIRPKQATRVVVKATSKVGTVEVAVKDALTHQPVPDIREGLMETRPELGYTASGLTNAEGMAIIRIPPGSYSAGWPMNEEYPMNAEYLSIRGTTMGGRPVRVTDGQTVRVQFEVKRGPEVSGRVTGPDGKPVAGAVIEQAPWSKNLIWSDSAGKFSIRWHPGVLGAPNHYFLVARVSEKLLIAAEEINISTKAKTLNLVPGATTIGRVIDENGAPVPMAKVEVETYMGKYDNIHSITVFTDADGRFAAGPVLMPDGKLKYYVKATAPGFAPAEYNEGHSRQDGTVQLDDIVLIAANASISGIVLDKAGKPVAGTRVYAASGRTGGEETYTDANGRFTIAGVSSGLVQVSAGSPAKGIFGITFTHGGDRNVTVVFGKVEPDPRLPRK